MNIDPLTPEERDLAQRLARLGPHGEPSPALDARILAAAHAATAVAPSRQSKPRWPVVFGIAASLALAVGIAWQLRPLPEVAVYDEAASATTVQAESSDMAAESAAGTVPQPRAELPSADFGQPAVARSEARKERKVIARAPPVGSTAADAAAKAAPEAFPQTAAPSPPKEPEEMFDEPMPVAAPAPPPAPAAAATTSRALAAPATAHENDTQADAVMDIFEADEEVVPPATADSPEVREAWLQRIHELVQAGKTDEARDSLREFQHRYPAHPVPDDLRALVE